MEMDSGIKLDVLRTDGGMVENDLLMQFQADILNRPSFALSSEKPRRWDRRMPPDWRSDTTRISKNSAPTGESTTHGSHRWRTLCANVSTRIGKRR